MINLAKKLSLFALVALLSISCKDAAKEGETNEETTPAVETTTEDTTSEASPEVAANLETTSFKIDGMTCAVGCAGVIENKLAGLDGVENAKVDFENKTATISFDAAIQTPETIVSTVENIANGIYKVSEIKNSGDKAELFKTDQEQEKKKKAKKGKASKKAKKAKGCSSKKCCASKKSCGDKEAKKA